MKRAIATLILIVTSLCMSNCTKSFDDNNKYSIVYTTVDGNILDNVDFHVLQGCYIISHVYSNGYGIILCNSPIRYIPSGLFKSESTLQSIVIPFGVTEIENQVFYDCKNLTEIIIPSSVTSIGEKAFSHCEGLTSVSIGGVTTIGDYAFYTCSNLTDVFIGNHIKRIGSYAFHSCGKPTSVYCHSTTPPSLGSNAFKRFGYGGSQCIECYIYVPTESVDAYKSAAGWREYADYIVGYEF